MPPRHKELPAFLAAFDRNSTALDIPALLSQFAETFMAAGPDGARAVTGAQFAAMLPKRKELFDKLGATSTALHSFEETALDSRYTLARTKWRVTFAREGTDSKHVFLHSTLIVDTGGEAPKVIFYLAHNDILSVLREEGIVDR